MKNYILYILLFLFAVSCGKDENPELLQHYFIKEVEGFTLEEKVIDVDFLDKTIDLPAGKPVNEFVMINTGNVNVDWHIEAPDHQLWFNYTPNNGSFTPNDTVRIKIEALKDYGDGTIIIDRPREILKVIFNNEYYSEIAVSYSNAQLDISTNELMFNAEITKNYIDISNTVVNASFSWEIVSFPEWLSFNSTEGEGTFERIEVTLNPDLLNDGEYTAEIIIDSDIGTATIAVSATIFSDLLIETINARDISQNTALLSGRIVQLGGAGNAVQHGFCWSDTNTEPTTDDNKSELGSIDNSDEYSAYIFNLTDGTKYYYRAYATDNETTAYGEVFVFYTNYSDEKLMQYNGIAEEHKSDFMIEDFDNNNHNWPIESETSKYSTSLGSGEYVVYVHNTDYMYTLWSGTTNENSIFDYNRNFEIEIYANIASSQSSGTTGIAWGKSNSGFYYFYINKDQKYGIGEYNGSWQQWVPYTGKFVNPVLEYNKLTVRKYGNYLYFFVNENFVEKHIYKAKHGNIIGLTTGASTYSVYDSLHIKYIGSNTKKSKQPATNITEEYGNVSYISE